MKRKSLLRSNAESKQSQWRFLITKTACTIQLLCENLVKVVILMHEIYPFGKILLRKCLFTALQHKLEEIFGILINFSNDVDSCTEDRLLWSFAQSKQSQWRFLIIKTSCTIELLCENLVKIVILKHEIYPFVKYCFENVFLQLTCINWKKYLEFWLIFLTT